LFFVTPDDIAVDAEEEPVRPYDYTHVGFFSDEDLEHKVSETVALDGDTDHEKVRIEDHPTLFVADDKGAVFRLEAGDKPSPNRRNLIITRVR
jgi:hypothetical protein